MTMPTPGGGAGCYSILAGLIAPSLLGACAAGSPIDVPNLVRVVIFLVVTAAVGALVFGIWRFADTTPVPTSRKDNPS